MPMNHLKPRIAPWLPILLVTILSLALFLLPTQGVSFQTVVNDSIFYEKGRVEQVLDESLEPSALPGGQMLGTQELAIRLEDGRRIELVNYLTDTHNVLVREGARVVVCVDAPEGVEPYYTLYNHDRSLPLAGIVLFFLALMLLVGGRRGAASAAALVFSVLLVLRVTIPAIYNGAQPVVMGLLTVLVSTAVTILLLYGWNLRGALAIGVTLGGECVACLLFLIFSACLRLTGFQTSDAENLLVVAQHTGLRLGSVLFAATMIASLGAVMDVAVSLLSALWELAGAAEAPPRGQLLHSGLNVGRDIIGTNCNTLIFAFVGGALMTILVLFSYGVQPNQLISSDYVALELAQGLCGTCAVILTVPLASLAAAACFGKQKVPGLSGLHTAKNGKK